MGVRIFSSRSGDRCRVEKPGVQVCAEDSRRDGVHVDAITRPLDGEAASQRQHGRLRRGVGGHFQKAYEGGERCDVDDPPAPVALSSAW